MALALALGASSASSFAQDALPAGTGFDLHLFRQAVDSKGQFSVNGTDTLGHLSTSFGLIVDWAHGLARQGTLVQSGQTQTSVPLVADMFSGVFSANLGLFNRLVLGVQLPAHFVGGPGPMGSDGSSLQPIAGYAPPPGGLSYQGFGSVTVHAKLRLLPTSVTHWGLALLFQAAFPLQSGPQNFAGDPGITLWPSLAAEWHPVSRFRMDLNVGYRFALGDGAALAGTTYGSPLTAGLGMSVRVGPAIDLVAEVYGATYSNALFGANTTPVEAVGGLKIFVVNNSYLMLGAGRRITNADAGSDVRAFVGFVFEPSIGDRDGDGIRDDVDQCPDEPEDFDHFEDSDGCPDPDNDQDGIPDRVDQCPNTPEDRDGVADDDGCPDPDSHDRDGDGINDDVDQCPDQPEDRDGFQDTDGCPDPDNDHDGILDRDDLCPNDPEDRDGFEDADGCPDPDNDHDRIPDTRDRCPNDPETYNAFEDEDGCRLGADPAGEHADHRGRGGDAARQRADPAPRGAGSRRRTRPRPAQPAAHAGPCGQRRRGPRRARHRSVAVARRGLRRAVPGQRGPRAGGLGAEPTRGVPHLADGLGADARNGGLPGRRGPDPRRGSRRTLTAPSALPRAAGCRGRCVRRRPSRTRSPDSDASRAGGR